MRGTVVLSETILASTGILISFILVVLVVQLVFSQQSGRTFESTFESLARDISTSIDRTAAVAGSIQIQQEIPKGLKFDLNIDYKTVIIKYEGNKAVRNSFVGLIKSGPYLFHNPEILCIVKTINDNRVMITDKKCNCNENDDVCDVECNLKNVCDVKCMSDKSGVCNPLCSKIYPSTCDPNCYKNEITGVCEVSCIKPSTEDGICSPDCDSLKKGVCDLDCYKMYSNGKTGVCDLDCPYSFPPEKIKTTSDGIKVKISDGNCYSGCVNYTKTDGTIVLKYDGICDEDCKNSENVCDPDCVKSMSSEACKNKCTEEGQKLVKYPCCEGLTMCPGDNICVKDKLLACCGNGKCEGRPGTLYGWGPGNKTKWETNYTCYIDCKDVPINTTFNKPITCQGDGPFTSSVCYRTVDNDPHHDEVVWNSGIIQVCDQEITTFLDRRNWDIKEVIKTWTDETPEAWAWDNARYQDACNSNVMLKASVTVSSNEKYNLSINKCCSLSGAPCAANAEYTPQCIGVGFCIDHSTAVLSVLRTLGVPAKNVYSTFQLSSGSAHAWVLFKCNATEPENRKPQECYDYNLWGKWLSIDATAHHVGPYNPNTVTTICLMWNDQGIYAQTEGWIDNTRGYAYDKDVKSSSTDPSICLYDKLCKQAFGIDCVVP
jgi:hypothetical protein